MSKTRIFVSSTCYDLAPVRESLRDLILELGHEPLLSDYPSFPVNPDKTAIENCQKNVAMRSDILLIIIGGTRGALDTTSGKSITNLEYESARQNNVPCFVFIMRRVDSLLPVWKKNPNADFTTYVDYPEVFQFIERIRAENRWVFTFEKTAEINQCLIVQLSAMLRELLERNRAGKLDPIPSFAGESREARRLAQEKPRFWEFLLTAELMQTKLAEVRKRYDRLKSGLVHVPTQPIEVNEFIPWLQGKIVDMIAMVGVLQAQIPRIEASWGPSGQPGDAQEIKRTVDEFVRLAGQIVDWEEDLKAKSPPESLRRLKGTMSGSTEFILKQMERLPKELLVPFENGAEPKGTHEIILSLKAPSFDEFNLELKAFRQGQGVTG